MPVTRWNLAMIAWFLGTTSASAIEVGSPDPLFQSNDALRVKITAPMSTLLSERPFDDELPATFEYQNTADETVVLDIQIRTRGRFRRKEDICPFPPLRLNFKAAQVEDTLFRKQDKVKLVTHCKNTGEHTQSVLREFLTYRMMNALTASSFRVRLLVITYIDSENRNDRIKEFGFIIEHRDRLARRMGMDVVETVRTEIERLDPEFTNLVSVFHYMIGNTDFSPIVGMKEDFCCHNHILIGNEGQPFWSVPYDFDQSGMVDAPHAGPNPRFRLKSVKQRLYRGRCINNHLLEDTLEHYRAKRAEIESLVNDDSHINKRSRIRMLQYLKSFYRTLESEGRIKREFTRACIGRGGSG